MESSFFTYIIFCDLYLKSSIAGVGGRLHPPRHQTFQVRHLFIPYIRGVQVVDLDDTDGPQEKSGTIETGQDRHWN